MGMGVQQGDTLHITVDGADEAEATETLQKFLKENL